jgi:hypothetical protein
MSEAPPIVDAATIADVRAVLAEAQGRGDQAAVEVAEACSHAAVAANEGRMAVARASLERAM